MLIVLAGYVAFIVASLVLGTRLMLLWRRTRELPELATGLAFVLGGGIGYLSWFALALIGGAPEQAMLRKVIVLIGMGCSCMGSVWYGLGTAQIFRVGLRWPRFGIAFLGGLMLATWIALARVPAGQDAFVFWYGMLASGVLYLWGAAESFMLARTLDRRARLGMANPIVVNRTAQWGIAALMISGMITVSFTSRLVFGLAGPDWVRMLTAMLGLVAAIAIWIGFFPSRRMQARIARVYGN